MSQTIAQPLGTTFSTNNLANIVRLGDVELELGADAGGQSDGAFLESALATVDAVAARAIVDPEKFKNGISKIIDGTVDCLIASTWAKQAVRPQL